MKKLNCTFEMQLQIYYLNDLKFLPSVGCTLWPRTLVYVIHLEMSFQNETTISYIYEITRGCIRVSDLTKYLLLYRKPDSPLKWAVSCENVLCSTFFNFSTKMGFLCIISPHLTLTNFTNKLQETRYNVLTSFYPEESGTKPHRFLLSAPLPLQLSMFSNNELIFYVAKFNPQSPDKFDILEEINGFCHLKFEQII